MQEVRILVVENRPGDKHLVEALLRQASRRPFDVVVRDRLAEALACLSETGADVVLLDLVLPDSQGLETFARVHAAAPEVPVIVVTDVAEENVAHAAVRAGAQDYLVRGHAADLLLPRMLAYAIERKANESALRQAHHALLQQTATLESVLSATSDPLFLFDEQKRCRYASRAGSAVLGVPEASLVERRWADLDLPPDFLAALDEALDRVLETGSRATWEMTHQAGDARRTYEYVLNPVAGADGASTGAVLAAHDVTGRVAAQASLSEAKVDLEQRIRDQTAELVAANEELEAFAYSVSHDLRAPLRALAGFSRALEEDYADRLDEEGERYVRYVQDAAQQMSNLIDDLLSLSRVTRSDMQYVSVDLTAAAQRIVHVLRTAEPDRDVTVEIEDGLVAHGDEVLLILVLQNLLGNAWKYTRRTPNARVSLTAQRRDGETVFCVRDNGAGFDPAYGDKLFQPFQRLHSAHEFEGNGIGLATAYRILRRHGGRIWAEGAVDRGAAFYFSLSGKRAGEETS